MPSGVRGAPERRQTRFQGKVEGKAPAHPRKSPKTRSLGHNLHRARQLSKHEGFSIFPVWASVKVTNPDPPRVDTAGTVVGVNPEKPEEVSVRFDTDLVTEVVAVADLKQLG